MPKFKFCLCDYVKENKMFLPTRSEPFATGYDVRCSKDLIINPYEYFKAPLGFKVIPEEGWWFYLNPRSSTFIKKNLHVNIGIIDEHYEDEIAMIGQYIPNKYSWQEPFKINAGDPIGQIIPIERINMDVEEISEKEFAKLTNERNGLRKTKGFGEMGK